MDQISQHPQPHVLMSRKNKPVWLLTLALWVLPVCFVGFVVLISGAQKFGNLILENNV